MLIFEGVTHNYGKESTIRLPDFKCEQGDRLLILGQSGSGKTTLLNLIGGLLELQTGSIQIDGNDLTSISKNQLDHFRGNHIGFVFQKPHFVASLSILENIMLASQLAGKKPDRDRALHLLDVLNIADKAHKKPDRLSAGEQQRASIARALINKPELLLADEPTSALDDINCDQVINLLEKASSSENATLVIVTHDQRLKDHFSNQILLEK
jgi:lipoprotein-releasing system ATP-binding protein